MDDFLNITGEESYTIDKIMETLLVHQPGKDFLSQEKKDSYYSKMTNHIKVKMKKKQKTVLARRELKGLIMRKLLELEYPSSEFDTFLFLKLSTTTLHIEAKNIDPEACEKSIKSPSQLLR